MNIRQQLDFAFIPDQQKEQIRGPLLVSFNNALQRCQLTKTRLGAQAADWAEFGNLREMNELDQLRNKEITALTEFLNAYVAFGELIARIEGNNLLATCAAMVFTEYTRLLTESLRYTRVQPAGAQLNAQQDRARFTHGATRKAELFRYEIEDAINILSASANALRQPNQVESSANLSAAVTKHYSRFYKQSQTNKPGFTGRLFGFIALAAFATILILTSSVAFFAAATMTPAAPALIIGMAAFFAASWTFGAAIASKGITASIGWHTGSRIGMDAREKNHAQALTRFAGLFPAEKNKPQPSRRSVNHNNEHHPRPVRVGG